MSQLHQAEKAQKLKAAPLLQKEYDPDSEAQMWLLMYLAQHAVHAGDTATAITHIEAALAKRPDIIDLYSTKADVLAAAGDLPGAAASANVARQLDTGDRFLNSTCARFEFRSGNIEAADATVVPFSRELDSGRSNLFDMQCMWYEIEAGSAHLRRGNLGMALKMFRAVVSQFADITEDQFDFHSYCLRKVTLRAYIDMLRMEDRLYSHPSFVDAALGAITCYVRLHDNPPGQSERDEEDRKVAAMTPEQKKKYLAKKKKEEEKAAKLAAEKLEKERAAAKAKKGNAKFDEDPTGEKLTLVPNPLEEADKLLQKLKESAGDRLGTHVAAFEVAIRRNKPLAALQAVKQAFGVAGGAPEPHELLVRLVEWVRGNSSTAGHAIVKAVLDSELKSLTGGKSGADLNSAFLKRYGKTSILHRLAAAKSQRLLRPDAPGTAADLVAAPSILSTVPHTVEDCVTVHEWLSKDAVDATAAERFHESARTHYPYSYSFNGAKRLPLPDNELIAQLKKLHVATPDAASCITRDLARPRDAAAILDTASSASR